MQKEVKKMEFYSEQIRFMCKYKLETTDAVDELKNQKLREKQIILNKRSCNWRILPMNVHTFSIYISKSKYCCWHTISCIKRPA